MNNDKIPRKIRSFVRREGRMTPKQERALAQFWPRFGIDYRAAVIDFESQFARSAELVLEIGFGMGDSLLEMASKHPAVNYLGIEVHRPGVGSLLAELAAQDLKNVRVMAHDAVEVLSHCIADQTLDRVHIYFPDPWPKKRHHKRRLIQNEFINLVVQKLKTGGYLHLATDWENYAEHMLAVCNECHALENQAAIGMKSIQALRPATKFEVRGIKLGHAVWDYLFRKLG